MFVQVVICLIIKERGMLQTNPDKFTPLVLPPKLQANLLLLHLCTYYFRAFCLHTVSQPTLTQKTALTDSCKLRGNKCVIYNRTGFVIPQRKLQHVCKHLIAQNNSRRQKLFLRIKITEVNIHVYVYYVVSTHVIVTYLVCKIDF